MPAAPFTVEELEDSPTEVWSRQNGAAHVRKFKVPWAQRNAFKDIITAGGYPTDALLVVDSVRCIPFNKRPASRDTGTNMDPLAFLNSFESAIVEVSYKSQGGGNSAEQQQVDGTRISFTREATGEFLSVPGRSLYWTTTDEKLPPDAHPVMNISITRWKFTWSGVKRPPWTAIERTKGKINNSNPFILPGVGLGPFPGTLLFEGATNQVDAQFGQTGVDVTLSLTYSFLQKQLFNLMEDGALDVVGWKQAINPETGQWDTPYSLISEGVFGYLYQDADFRPLFIQEGP